MPSNETQQCFTVPEEQAGFRLDHFLAGKFPEMSRSFLQKCIIDGTAVVNGKAVPKNYKVKASDRIQVVFQEPRELEILPEDIPLDIVYEDNDLLVVNKPKGMVVHPAAGNQSGTLVNALLHHCGGSLSGINGVIRPGIVHRIDKNTSGLLLVAKNDRAHQSLAAQIQEHTLLREYQAVVYGIVKQESGKIDQPIGRHRQDRKKMCVTDFHARNAVTHFEVIQHYEGFTHMKFRLETGRTHQIRVHMASIGHPVAGDDVYGPKKVIKHLEGQCLHAKTIGFRHPATGEWRQFESELPPYFERFLRQLKAR